MKLQPASQGLILGGGVIVAAGAFLVITWVATSQPIVLVLAVAIVALGAWFLVWGLSKRRAERVAAQQARASSPPAPGPRPSAPPAVRASSAPSPAVAPSADQRAALAEAEAALLDVAKRTVKPAQDLTYYFICSGNESLIRAYYDLLKVGAPVYGGLAALYGAEDGELRSRKSAAADLPFDGTKHLVTTVSDVNSVADALTGIAAAGFRGVFVTLVAVGPTGRGWVEEAYVSVLGDAVKQGIFPFPMLVTHSGAAARFLADSFHRISGSPLPVDPGP